jgi:GT2 family glycosyltransferase
VNGGTRTANPRPVTIVVPIYADLPAVIACVDSLKQNVDLEQNRVLLVNDCGPDADVLEASLLARIEGCGAIRYERNERNLGYVGTCNRAVTELDTSDNDILLLNSDTVATPGFLQELSAVLHLSPFHGIVCARSNNASIASFPFATRDPATGYRIARTREVYAALFGTIRRYSIAPVAHGFCLLIRRELITRYGLFDDAFAPGLFEEYDFCLRMNKLGYLSILANHAMVFHLGNRSFEGEANPLLSAHEKVFVQRYPFYWKAIETYLFVDRDPVDAFADALVPADEVRRVLLDIDVIPHAGLPNNTRALLAALQKASDPKRLVASVSIPEGQRDVIGAQYPALQVIHHSRLDRVWDVAVASGNTVSRTQLIRLNRVSPRWIFTSSGIGGGHTWRDRAADLSSKALVEDAIRHADGIIALRPGVRTELESYAGGAIINLLADRIAELDGVDADGIVQKIVEQYGRSTIGIERLRARWDYFARLRCYERETVIRRLIRRAEYAAPRPVRYAKGVVRKLRGL